jgi:predicted nucleotide-binding protein (sugar kinase/HSP70/actin superfamily)
MRRFDSAGSRIGRFDPSGRKLLMPEMSPVGSRLLAAAFRAAGVDAEVMETYRGLSLGKEFTSGKECFPCMVTLGDILSYLRREKERLGDAFSGDRYVYFLPESDGPCRFGVYNMLQRMVLDHFPELCDVDIASVTSEDAYSLSGLIPKNRAGAFQRLAFSAITIGDALDRIVRRARPYESRQGAADECQAASLATMEKAIESGGVKPDYGTLMDHLTDTAISMRSLMDHSLPRRPRIGIVGEIYVRCHPGSNQEVVRLIEQCGGEVVNSSVSEWFTFIKYTKGRERKRLAKQAWRRRRFRVAAAEGRQWLVLALEYAYLQRKQTKIYGIVRRHLDIQADAAIGEIERHLSDDRFFSFDIGTETAMSIGGALEFAHEGFNGVVNVFPFSCLPGGMASAVLNPLLGSMKVPYMESSYDGTIQSNREIAISTFVHQARQHMQRQPQEA